MKFKCPVARLPTRQPVVLIPRELGGGVGGRRDFGRERPKEKVKNTVWPLSIDINLN